MTIEEEIPGTSLSLADAVAKLQLDISAEQVGRVEAYCHALWDWNSKLNLTRHTDFDTFARRDLLDTLRLSKLLQAGEEVLDVGTGGGVPGLPLAILRPDLCISVCDSVGKKARAVQDMVQKLNLPVAVHAARVQDVLEDLRYDTLVTRAVGSLSQLCGWLRKDWHNFRRLLAIKGPRWDDEKGEARHRGLLNGIRVRRIDAYKMPGTESESVILQIERPRPGT